jgi:hypothetical protein
MSSRGEISKAARMRCLQSELPVRPGNSLAGAGLAIPGPGLSKARQSHLSDNPVVRRHGRRWPDPDRCAGATARDRSLHHRGAPPPAVRRGVEIEQTEGRRRSSWPASDPWRIAAAHSPGRLLEPHTDGTIRRARPGTDRRPCRRAYCIAVACSVELVLEEMWLMWLFTVWGLR